MSEHLHRLCAPQRSAAGKPSTCVVVYSKAPSQWRPGIRSCARVCLSVHNSGNEIGRGMVTDRNVIQPLIINAPHLIQPDTHCYTHINRAINTRNQTHMLSVWR